MTLDLTSSLDELELFFRDIHLCRNKNDLTHGMHPYPAKFIPHIPREVIRALMPRSKGLVLDPMCGSGTTLIEATRLGHDAIGIDLNPIATLVSRAKTTRATPEHLVDLQRLGATVQEAALAVGRDGELPQRIPADAVPNFHNRDRWFEPHVIQELTYLKRCISQLSEGPAKTIALCLFSACIVQVSNQESETRWCVKRHSLPPGDALTKFADKCQRLVPRLQEYAGAARGTATVARADARAMPLDDGVADLIVSSPPYANSHDYYLYNKLRMFWLGDDVSLVQRREIGSRNRHSDQKEDIDTYLEAMQGVLGESRRVMKPGGRAVFVVADAIVRGDFFDMGELFPHIARQSGLDVERAYRFSHRTFNSAFQRGFGTRMDKSTHVIVFAA